MIRAAAVGAGLAFCLFAGAGLLLQWAVGPTGVGCSRNIVSGISPRRSTGEATHIVTTVTPAGSEACQQLSRRATNCRAVL